MRQISNSSMQTLLRHLPRVLKAVEGTGDARLSESARLLYGLVKKFRRAERGTREEIVRALKRDREKWWGYEEWVSVVGKPDCPWRLDPEYIRWCNLCDKFNVER